MTKQQFLSYCLSTYSVLPDYLLEEDFVTAVLRYADNRKWYAFILRGSHQKFDCDRDDVIDVVNLKALHGVFGSLGAEEGVYHAYYTDKFGCIRK